MPEESNDLLVVEREPAPGAEGRPAPPAPTGGESLADVRLASLEKLIEFQRALDVYLRELVPQDSIRWVENRKDGTKRPVLERQQYAKVFRAFSLSEPEPPKFERYEIGREVVFECTTRVVWQLMGTEAWGVACASTDEVYGESLGRRMHDAKARAHTRAWERAIANLIGLGALGEEEAAGHPELREVSPALKFVLEMATKKGISKDELRVYVETRWQGEALEQLPTARVVTLKKVIEQIKSKEDWEREMKRWGNGS